jgi:hypothetical protein
VNQLVDNGPGESGLDLEAQGAVLKRRHGHGAYARGQLVLCDGLVTLGKTGHANEHYDKRNKTKSCVHQKLLSL